MKFEMKREILVVLNPNGFAQAPFLSGVLAFARHHPRLNVTIDDAPASFDLAKLNSYLDEGVDGVIVSETGIVDLPQILNQTRVPIVVFGSPKPCTRKSNIAFVMSNDTGIGIAAARHLFNLGRFRDFAFIPCQGRGWSEKELHGFDAFLKRKRMTAKSFPDPAEANSLISCVGSTSQRPSWGPTTRRRSRRYLHAARQTWPFRFKSRFSG